MWFHFASSAVAIAGMKTDAPWSRRRGSSGGPLIFPRSLITKYKLIRKHHMILETCNLTENIFTIATIDRLCSLVIRVPAYRCRDPGFCSRRYQIFWEVVGLERGSLSLVRITEELLEWWSSGSGSRKSRLTAVGIRCADDATPSIRKSLH
jgi:hypothetical protein